MGAAWQEVAEGKGAVACSFIVGNGGLPMLERT